MAEFTFLKLQVEDATITANAPFSGSDGSETEAELDDTESEESGSEPASRRLLPLVVGLVGLLILVLLIRKLRGGSDDTPVATDE